MLDHWLRMGRVLPRGVRERIFEPALHDLLADVAARTSTTRATSFEWGRLGLRVFLLTIDSARVGIVDALVRDRRPTRAGWALLVLAAVTTIVAAFSATVARYHVPIS